MTYLNSKPSRSLRTTLASSLLVSLLSLAVAPPAAFGATKCPAPSTTPSTALQPLSLPAPKGLGLDRALTALKKAGKSEKPAQMKALLELLWKAFLQDMTGESNTQIPSVAARYRELFKELRKENSIESIRALYDRHPILLEWMEEAQDSNAGKWPPGYVPLYARINRALWKFEHAPNPLEPIRAEDPGLAAKIEALDCALSELSNVSGIVYRGGWVDSERVQRLMDGQVTEYSNVAFASTSANIKDAAGFAQRAGGAGRVKTLFVMRLKRGHLVSLDPETLGHEATPYLTEEEILLPRATPFNVLGATFGTLGPQDPDNPAEPLLFLFLEEK